LDSLLQRPMPQQKSQQLRQYCKSHISVCFFSLLFSCVPSQAPHAAHCPVHNTHAPTHTLPGQWGYLVRRLSHFILPHGFFHVTFFFWVLAGSCPLLPCDCGPLHATATPVSHTPACAHSPTRAPAHTHAHPPTARAPVCPPIRLPAPVHAHPHAPTLACPPAHPPIHTPARPPAHPHACTPTRPPTRPPARTRARPSACPPCTLRRRG
jgi:hypothetical protein